MAETMARPSIDATQLAWWAEEAHGRQGKTMYVVEGKNGEPELVPDEMGRRVFFEVNTTGRERPMVPPKRIVLQSPDGKEINLINNKDIPECDALFWTASSIEKFLFPYYASQRLLTDAQMDDLKSRYEKDDKLLAAGHRAPSKTELISAGESSGFFTEARTEDGRATAKWITLMHYLR